MSDHDGENDWNDIGVETSFRWSPPGDMVDRTPMLIDGDSIRSLAMADVERWAKLDYWTLDEATALYIGKCPDGFVWLDVIRHISVDRAVQQCQLFRRAAERLFSDGLMHTPAEIVEWAKGKDLIFAPTMVSAVDSKISTATPEQEQRHLSDWDEEKSTYKTSILRLILALVVDGYKIDPTGPVNGMKKLRYANDSIKFGEYGRKGPCDDTIVKILKEAVQMTGLRSEDVAAVLNGKSVAASRSGDRR